MGHLLVGRDPAAGILPPAELWEHSVEAGGQGGQYDLGVKVSDSLLWCCHDHTPLGSLPSLYQIWVVLRKWVTVWQTMARTSHALNLCPDPFRTRRHWRRLRSCEEPI